MIDLVMAPATERENLYKFAFTHSVSKNIIPSLWAKNRSRHRLRQYFWFIPIPGGGIYEGTRLPKNPYTQPITFVTLSLQIYCLTRWWLIDLIVKKKKMEKKPTVYTSRSVTTGYRSNRHKGGGQQLSRQHGRQHG